MGLTYQCALGSPVKQRGIVFQRIPSARMIGRLMMIPEKTHIEKMTTIMIDSSLG